MITIITVGVIGAVLSAIIGTIWYSNATPMGFWHMQYLGVNALSEVERAAKIAEAKPKMWKTYSAQIALSFLTSFFIAFVTSYTIQNGGPVNAVYYYIILIWFTFTIPIIGQGILWGTSEGSLAWKRFFSDSLYNLITFLIIAFVATLMV